MNFHEIFKEKVESSIEKLQSFIEKFVMYLISFGKLILIMTV